MSYHIEDSIDKFMVQYKSKRMAEHQHGLKKIIDRSLNLLMQPKIRHKIATEIKEIKSRVMEVYDRRCRYEVSLGVDKPVPVDPCLFTQYTDVKELVGIDEARDELIQILMEETAEPASKQQDKIVSTVGFGGLGKTTLANVVYEKLKAQFECSAFVSVSQTLDLERLLKGMFYQLAKQTNESTNVTRELREFLQNKRYFIVIDDIWNISDWKIIKCALPGNNVGNKIITTTRILNVAEQVGGAYKLQPISLCNSRKLFFRRIFGNKNQDNNKDIEECPDNELAEVSERILKKCAGVPLAIITMASVLACKPRDKMEWYDTYNSIGTGLENNLDVDNMRKILSFSYYELPCYLRTCLLYLSIFPEDFEIDKDCLIRMWISEGFIQCEKKEKSLYEIGENYFTELINRSMILPKYNDFVNLIYSCCLHDMMLDLIRSLSNEESFVTVLNDMNGASPSNKIRRLSLQSGKKSHILDLATGSLQHIRSVVVFQSDVAQVAASSSYGVLRVLELQYCNLSSRANCLKYLENLYHLRYLGLRRTRISQLPEEIENLQFLQTLDARDNKISRLPSAVVQLRNLMFLYVDSSTRVPNGIGNLTCLERLSWLGINDSTITVIEELCQLTQLRKLYIELDERIELDEQNYKLFECLCKLQKIQELVVVKLGYNNCNISGLDAWVVPRHLRILQIVSCWFSTLPVWVSPSLLLDLTTLDIAVRELHQTDLGILRRLPALRSLRLHLDHVSLGILRQFVVDAGSFPCLVYWEFTRLVWPVIFQQGAMPRLRILNFRELYVWETRGIASSDGGLDLGLGNLTSLQEVDGVLACEGASSLEAEQAEAALRNAAEMHPNHPRHRVSIWDRERERRIVAQ